MVSLMKEEEIKNKEKKERERNTTMGYKCMLNSSLSVGDKNANARTKVLMP